MEKWRSCPTERTEGSQAVPLAAISGLAFLETAASLLPTLRVCGKAGLWLAGALLGASVAGLVGYRFFRRGGLKSFSSFKLLLSGSGVIAGAGLVFALLMKLPVLLWLPGGLLGFGIGALQEALRGIYGNFAAFSELFPGEKGKLCRGLFLWLPGCLGGVGILCRPALSFLALRWISGICPTLLCAGLWWILSSCFCLCDQRGDEFRRKRKFLKEI